MASVMSGRTEQSDRAHKHRLIAWAAARECGVRGSLLKQHREGVTQAGGHAGSVADSEVGGESGGAERQETVHPPCPAGEPSPPPPSGCESS